MCEDDKMRNVVSWLRQLAVWMASSLIRRREKIRAWIRRNIRWGTSYDVYRLTYIDQVCIVLILEMHLPSVLNGLDI